MIAGVDHVQVAAPAGGEAAARAFYGELLGLPELPKPERLRPRGGAWFAVGDEQLHVGIEDPFAPARKAHPALAVPRAGDLRALADRLAAGGHEVEWDGPRFYVADPFGNRVELLAPHADVRVRELRDDERAWAATVLRERWGDIVVASGRELRPAELPALVAQADGERAGLATYALDVALRSTLRCVRKTSVYLTEHESKRLSDIARSEGRSQAEIIREAISAYVPPSRDDRDFALADGFARIDDDPRPISQIPEDELLEGFGA